MDFYPPSTAPAALDIVWCRFPFSEAPNTPPVEGHPCLVQSTLMRNDNNVFIDIAFGTSQLKRDHPSTQLHLFISNVRDMDECGLYKATRFDLDRVRRLPWSREWFYAPTNDYHTPVIGSLSGRSRITLQWLVQARSGKSSQD